MSAFTRQSNLTTKSCKGNNLKSYTFQVDEYQLEWIFSPIRAKRDVIALLMRTIKVMMLPPMFPVTSSGQITLQISKMSRLFFMTNDKMFSVNFPFVAVQTDDCLRFHSIHHKDVNSMIASHVLAILESNDSLESREVFHFAEPISDLCQSDADFLCLFRELLTYEDGYIRYDHDKVRSNGHIHPLDHLDVFYTTGNTFKLGLNRNISLGNFADVLDLSTNCYYVTTP